MTITFLHTSDFHLGQKLIGQNRDVEHEMMLNWLLDTIRHEQVDLLLVSGDVYDVNNPPVSAETLYFRFLARLAEYGCRHAVITGGNHDSPAKLEAPKKLLQALQIQVVGSAAAAPADDILYIPMPDSPKTLAVAAVPFLRDKDFAPAAAGESDTDRTRRMKEGIYRHYQNMAAALAEHQGPKIATGHLYAKGASATEEQQNIYIGNLENIAAEQFPEIFDYIALGHIHRPQRVGKQNHIRYCGSPMPLSFSELRDDKIVLIGEIHADHGLLSLRELAVPRFRRLLSLQGTMDEVLAKLPGLSDPDAPLPAWVDVEISGESGALSIDRRLRDAVQEQNLRLELLKIRNKRSDNAGSEESAVDTELQDLTPEQVFLSRCAQAELPPDKVTSLTNTFRELQAWMAETE